jgi:hypothetical protein
LYSRGKGLSFKLYICLCRLEIRSRRSGEDISCHYRKSNPRFLSSLFTTPIKASLPARRALINKECFRKNDHSHPSNPYSKIWTIFGHFVLLPSGNSLQVTLIQNTPLWDTHNMGKSSQQQFLYDRNGSESREFSLISCFPLTHRALSTEQARPDTLIN